MLVAVTGHRPDKFGGYAPNQLHERVKEALTTALWLLKEEFPNLRLVSGMALGVDQWAVNACLTLGVPFEAAVPFKGQELSWPLHAQETYKALLRQAAAVHIVSDGDYKPWKMQKRNEWMVDRCKLLLAVWDGSDGGTANCVRYAWSVERPVKRLEW